MIFENIRENPDGRGWIGKRKSDAKAYSIRKTKTGTYKAFCPYDRHQMSADSLEKISIRLEQA